MAINMGRAPFQRAVTNLTAGAALVPVGEADTSNVKTINISVSVAGSALSGFEVWARSDPDGAYFPLPIPSPAILAYGRSDVGTDVTTTPAGQAAFVQVDTTGWGGVQIRAKSTGAATVTVTAGGG